MKSIYDLVRNTSSDWTRSQPADPEDIARLQRRATFPLPNEYIEFLRASDGGEGSLGVEPGYFVVWPVNHVWESNLALELTTYLPGFFAFGGNGGGETLVFHFATGEPYPVCMVPSIGMALDQVLPVAPSFRAFVEQFGLDIDAQPE